MRGEPAKLHDELLSAGLPVDTVRFNGDAYEVLLASGATAAQAGRAEGIQAAFQARGPSADEALERRLDQVPLRRLAMALIRKGLLTEGDLRINEDPANLGTRGTRLPASSSG